MPVREGSEEYLDSEKYEVKERTLEGAPLLPLVKRLNRIRRENPALQRVDNLTFLETESDHLIAYAKVTGDNAVATVVNLDPFEAHEGVAILPASLGLPPSFAAARAAHRRGVRLAHRPQLRPPRAGPVPRDPAWLVTVCYLRSETGRRAARAS